LESQERIALVMKKIIRIAQRESELELGVNPLNFEQANTGYLSEKDFEYIRRVMALVGNRLSNAEWLTKTIDDIEGNKVVNTKPLLGVRFDDELFKTGRGILESYLKEKE